MADHSIHPVRRHIKMHPDRHLLLDDDRDRVDASAEHECEYWLRRFGVRYAELVAAVRDVGSRVTDLKRYFKDRA